LLLLTQESSVTRFLLFMKNWWKVLRLLSLILLLKKTNQLKFVLVLTERSLIPLVEERKWILKTWDVLSLMKQMHSFMTIKHSQLSKRYANIQILPREMMQTESKRFYSPLLTYLKTKPPQMPYKRSNQKSSQKPNKLKLNQKNYNLITSNNASWNASQKRNWIS